MFSGDYCSRDDETSLSLGCVLLLCPKCVLRFVKICFQMMQLKSFKDLIEPKPILHFVKAQILQRPRDVATLGTINDLLDFFPFEFTVLS